MPRFSEVINNFINGEVSPKVYGRMDSETYKRSCRTLKNMFVHPQGGSSRRVGTQFVTDYTPILESGGDDVVTSLVEGSRIIPFNFDDDEKYLIIFNKYQNSSGVNQIQYHFLDEDWVVAASFDDDKIVNHNGNFTSRATGALSTASVLDN